MNFARHPIAALVSLIPCLAAAADNQAVPAAEADLWALSERIALTLPGHPEDVSRLVAGSARTTPGRVGQAVGLPDREIGPSLFTRNAVMKVGAGPLTDSVTFNVSGSCIPFASLRSRYPRLIVLDYARDDSEYATYTFGTQVGDALIAYSFPGDDLNCMTRVDITPAAATGAR